MKKVILICLSLFVLLGLGAPMGVNQKVMASDEDPITDFESLFEGTEEMDSNAVVKYGKQEPNVLGSKAYTIIGTGFSRDMDKSASDTGSFSSSWMDAGRAIYVNQNNLDTSVNLVAPVNLPHGTVLWGMEICGSIGTQSPATVIRSVFTRFPWNGGVTGEDVGRVNILKDESQGNIVCRILEFPDGHVFESYFFNYVLAVNLPASAYGSDGQKMVKLNSITFWYEDESVFPLAFPTVITKP